ncbi:MAG: c-type cytochrome biogenesis protein CcmI [Gammaproteobacteria bacterium]|nr:c-type cytochrome biogenesis protein CcmI [Gammaproteobacteria bacterium]
MLLSFWLPVAILLIVALVFVLVPFIRYQKQESKLDVSSDWYRNREQELKQELAAGLFSEQEFQQAMTELKLTAKGELSLAAQEQGSASEGIKRGDKRLVYFSALLLVIAVVGFYGINGLYQKQQEKYDILAQMPELSQKIIQGSSQQVTPQELVHFALGLRSKLAEKEDYIGWMLLGRVYMSLNDVESGIDAFRKSYQMNRQNVSNTVSFAQALLYRGEDWDIQESLTMLQEAMMFQPDNVQALILFGEGSLMQEQFENAKRSFEIALSVLPEGDERVTSIQQRLDLLNRQTSATSSSNASGLAVNISLAADASVQLSEFSHLFLFAKSDVMPMPIAVKKVAVTELPVLLTLTDQDIMLPEQKLSQFETVTLFARLSKDENAEFSAGEWQGTLTDVSTKQSGVIELEISEEN